MEAELVVLDLRSTPVIDFRMRACDSLEEALFVQMTLGDDRAMKSTYIAGSLAHRRAERPGMPADHVTVAAEKVGLLYVSPIRKYL